MMTKKVGGIKWKNTVVRFFYKLCHDTTSLKGKGKLKMLKENPKATAKITKQRVISNKPTKEIK